MGMRTVFQKDHSNDLRGQLPQPSLRCHDQPSKSMESKKAAPWSAAFAY